MNIIVKTYRQCGTIKSTAEKLNVSKEIIRRELLNAGEIEPSDTMRKAREMYARGISPMEIEKTLHISHKALMRNLPREKLFSHWTEEEIQIVSNGKIPDGRSENACAVMRCRLNKNK